MRRRSVGLIERARREQENLRQQIEESEKTIARSRPVAGSGSSPLSRSAPDAWHRGSGFPDRGLTMEGLPRSAALHIFNKLRGRPWAQPVFLFCFRSHPAVTAASSEPSSFCGLYSNLILAKFSANWSVGR